MSVADAIPSRLEVADTVRSLGCKVVAVLPYHYPRALLRAHRLHPIELWGPPGACGDGGAAHLQAYTCGIVVNAVSFLLDGGLDPVDAILVPHTCDSLQGMASVVADFVQPRQTVLTFYRPRGQRPSDTEFLVAELRSLAERCAAVSGHRPDADDWDEAFAAEDAADAALASLYARRGGLAVSDRDFYTVVRAREFLIAEDFVELAASLPAGEAPAPGVGLMLSGIVSEPMEIFDRINAAGAHVACDDLACGARRVYPPGDAADLYARLAGRLLAAPPDPTCGAPIAERAAYLEGRMRETGATGLLVYDPKFCEPELFDVPILRERLGAAGFGMLHVETEMGTALSHQTETRIEAFVETLS